eukprot:gnl/MRDRNA2_/MRDRNA2_155806_c0_seq1.p1 gnl/MRDRNA2_/MRDRNA2_155806_c0~~gnl/MRDRNA2_/MRDRNA2_155806_c0_seq1.p1  ORF type:complete len:655 (+),score=72.89 gnl/MRDRNA2_/MRDRNA2_155806_c0_seq1:227-1966(+)
MSGIFGQWCIGCRTTLSELHTGPGVLAFRKRSVTHTIATSSTTTTSALATTSTVSFVTSTIQTTMQSSLPSPLPSPSPSLSSSPSQPSSPSPPSTSPSLPPSPSTVAVTTSSRMPLTNTMDVTEAATATMTTTFTTTATTLAIQRCSTRTMTTTIMGSMDAITTYTLTSLLTITFASFPTNVTTSDENFVNNVRKSIAIGFCVNLVQIDITTESVSRKLTETEQLQMQGVKIYFKLVTTSFLEATKVQKILADPNSAADFIAAFSTALVENGSMNGRTFVVNEISTEAATVSSKTVFIGSSSTLDSTGSSVLVSTTSTTSIAGYGEARPSLSSTTMRVTTKAFMALNQPVRDVIENDSENACKTGCTLQCCNCIGCKIGWACISSIFLCMAICIYKCTPVYRYRPRMLALPYVKDSLTSIKTLSQQVLSKQERSRGLPKEDTTCFKGEPHLEPEPEVATDIESTLNSKELIHPPSPPLTSLPASSDTTNAEDDSLSLCSERVSDVGVTLKVPESLPTSFLLGNVALKVLPYSSSKETEVHAALKVPPSLPSSSNFENRADGCNLQEPADKNKEVIKWTI